MHVNYNHDDFNEHLERFKRNHDMNNMILKIPKSYILDVRSKEAMTLYNDLYNADQSESLNGEHINLIALRKPGKYFIGFCKGIGKGNNKSHMRIHNTIMEYTIYLTYNLRTSMHP